MQLRRGVGSNTVADQGYSGGGGKNAGGGRQQQQQYEEPEDDRMLCKWCGRKFNETAGTRHIPVCE